MWQYPDVLATIAADAVARLISQFRALAPTFADRTEAWMRALAGGAEPERYFLHPRAFPMLLLPWWLEEHISGATPSSHLQSTAVYSSISGYYSIRMVDDLMDGAAVSDTSILPALGIFDIESVQAYRPIFGSESPFWDALAAAAYEGRSNAARDAELDSIDLDTFEDVSARKIAGAKVPIAAVCHRFERLDLLDDWGDLVDGFGRWHQMLNDIVDWARDLDQGRATLLLSEASRQAPGAEIEWLLQHGLAWGHAQARHWMEDSLESASRLGCPPLVRYLEWRHEGLEIGWRELAANLMAADRLRNLEC